MAFLLLHNYTDFIDGIFLNNNFVKIINENVGSNDK